MDGGGCGGYLARLAVRVTGITMTITITMSTPFPNSIPTTLRTTITGMLAITLAIASAIHITGTFTVCLVTITASSTCVNATPALRMRNANASRATRMDIVPHPATMG